MALGNETVKLPPTADETRAALARVLASQAFQSSPKLAAFLRFVVEATLSGQAERIKGYTIGTEALGRGQDFDPQTDPIVRVEAGRLRRTLESYYASVGADDPIVIALPVGSYVPTFTFRGTPASAPRASDVVPLALRWRRGRIALPVAAAGAFAVIAVIGALQLAMTHPQSGAGLTGSIDRPAASVGPSIYVAPIVTVDMPVAPAIVANLVRDRLIDAFTRFDDVNVLTQAAPSQDLGREVASPKTGYVGAAAYELGTRIERHADGAVSVTFRLIDAADGGLAWSKTYDNLPVADDRKAGKYPVISQLATTLFHPLGVIQTRERRKRAAGREVDPRYACVLASSELWRSFDPAQDADVRGCLERAVADEPAFAGGFALLAKLNLREFQFGHGAGSSDPAALDRALALANRAIELKPDSARSHYILLEILMARGAIADALAAGEKAVALNPFDLAAAFHYGAALVRNGNIERGLEYLQQADSGGAIRQPQLAFLLSVAAYLQGDNAAAARYAARITSGKDARGLLARALVAHKAGDAERARAAYDQLVALQQVWRDDPRGELGKSFSTPAIVERLAADLAAIGSGETSAATQVAITKPVSVDVEVQTTWRPGPGLPLLVVEPVVIVGAGPDVDAGALQRSVRDALARFDEVRVRTESFPAGAQRVAPVDETIDYRLAATFEAQDRDAPRLTFRLLDGANDSVVWSKTYRNLGSGDPRRVGENVLLDLISALVGPDGVIQPNDRRKRAAGMTIDPRYSCILDAYEYWQHDKFDLHERVRGCVERLTATNPEFSLGFALLTYVYLREHYFARVKQKGDVPAADRAFDAARRAIQLNPNSALAYHVLSAALFARNNVEQGIAASKKAVELNPYNVAMVSGLGARMIRAGEVDRGLALMRQAAPFRSGLSSWYAFMMCIGSYLSGDLAGAVKYDLAAITDTFPPGLVASALVATKTGDQARARQALERLNVIQPGWRENPKQELAKIFQASWIVDRLARDLAALGLGTPDVIGGIPAPPGQREQAH